MQPHHRSTNAFVRLQCASSRQFVLWLICQTFHTMLFLYFYSTRQKITDKKNMYFIRFYIKYYALKKTLVAFLRWYLYDWASHFLCARLWSFWRPTYWTYPWWIIMKIIKIYLKNLIVISVLRASSENELKVRFARLMKSFSGMAFAWRRMRVRRRPARSGGDRHAIQVSARLRCVPRVAAR